VRSISAWKSRSARGEIFFFNRKAPKGLEALH
jgi:hypothetical protein